MHTAVSTATMSAMVQAMRPVPAMRAQPPAAASFVRDGGDKTDDATIADRLAHLVGYGVERLRSNFRAPLSVHSP